MNQIARASLAQRANSNRVVDFKEFHTKNPVDSTVQQPYHRLLICQGCVIHSLKMNVATSLVAVKSLCVLSRKVIGLRVPIAASWTAAKAPTSSFIKSLHISSSSSSSSRGSSVDDNSDESGKRNNTCVVSTALDFLGNKKRVIEDLSPADYVAVDRAIGASVGSHIRHLLDHFAKCLDVLNSSSSQNNGDNCKEAREIIRYDHRARGGEVETDPSEAVKLISRLMRELNALPRGSAGSEKLRSMVVSPAFFLGEGGASSDGHQEHEFLSNLERELFFCCHHGTHHDAMIRLILERMAVGGGEVARALAENGKSLGVAPSTVKFRQLQQKGLDD